MDCMARNDLDLAVARLGFLSAVERISLIQTLEDENSLLGLRKGDLELLVRRSLPRLEWHPARYLDQAHTDRELAQRFGIQAVPFLSASYPPLLREIPDPPTVLWVRGSLPDPTRASVAVVGTRVPSTPCAAQAYRFGREFAEAGVAVVSGLARGIDALAHRGCAEAGGATFAVLGCGCDCPEPKMNLPVARRLLAEGGGLLSEYPPGTQAMKHHFPARNRIIAALCRSTVIVEAPERSGALITADFALQDGRDLYVGSESQTSLRGVGTRRLAEDGAPVIDSAYSVLSDWGLPLPRSMEAALVTQG